MTNFNLGGGLGRRLSEALGRRTEESDAEVDRATRDARIEHEKRLEARRSDFDRLRHRIEEMPSFVMALKPNEAMFTSIYKPTTLRLREGFEVEGHYGMTIPAERLDEAVQDHEARAAIAEWVRINPPNHGRSQIPFAYLGLKSKRAPEVYTIGQTGRENDDADLLWLANQLAMLEARNLTRDHVFSGKELLVHARLYAYWSGSLQYDRQGVAVALTRVGVKV